MKDAAAQLTQLSDELLHSVVEESKAERRRIQQEAEGRASCRWWMCVDEPDVPAERAAGRCSDGSVAAMRRRRGNGK